MTRVSKELVVFVASPSDLEDERQRVRDVAASVTHALGARLGATIRVTGWEEVQPDLGRPQDQINPFVDECDVFIGLVNQRMGSPTGASSSGFIEEFERASERRGDGDVPHIAVFFKTVPAGMLADPGKELSRVLKFKKGLETRHRLLYRPFENADALAASLWALLSSKLLELSEVPDEGNAGGLKGAQSNLPDGALISEDPKNVDEAQGRIAEVAGQLQQAVQGVGSIVDIDRDRLVLVALALAGDAGLVPTHVANRLYRRRRELILSTMEHRLWLRTLLADLGNLNRDYRVIPGWGALLPEDDSELAMSIVSSVAHAVDDDNDSVAAGVFRMLQLYGIRPASLWRVNEDDASDSWANALGRPAVATAARSYLAALAAPADSGAVRAIADISGDPDVADLAALLGGDTRPAALAVANRFSSPDWKVTAVSSNLEGLDDEVTEQLLVGRYTPSDLRAAAFEILQRRDGLSLEVLRNVLGQPDMQDAVFAAAADLDSPVRTDDVAALIAELDNDAPNIFDLRERAVALATPTASLIAGLDDPGAATTCWTALGWVSAPDLVERAREVFDSDGSAIVDMNPAYAEFEHRDFVLGKARIASLRILTSQETVATEDVDRVRLEVARDSLTRLQATDMFYRVATAEDLDSLQAATSRMYGAGKAAVVQRLFDLGGNDIAHRLLESDDSSLRLAAVRHICSQPAEGPELFRKLLYSSDPTVRMAAVDALAQRLSGSELETLLSDYPDFAADTYYYNVMCELDWLAYGRRARPPDEVAAIAATQDTSAPPGPSAKSGSVADQVTDH